MTQPQEMLDAVARQLGHESANDLSVFRWDLALDLPEVIPAVLIAAAIRLEATRDVGAAVWLLRWAKEITDAYPPTPEYRAARAALTGQEINEETR